MPETQQTRFSVPGMDCPSEERLIRMALEPIGAVGAVAVNLDDRTVTVRHDSAPQTLLDALTPLGLGTTLVESGPVPDGDTEQPADDESRVLKLLLAINATMFLVELVVAWIADSTGLLADSLDMLADALVYSISLYAVGGGGTIQYRAARLSGIAQLLLALGVIGEVGRRAIYGSEPESIAMMAMAVVALGANVACVWLLRRHRDGGVHMQASWIFSTNDAVANLGVVVAGALVLLTGSAIPDLVIGTVIALVVGRGALRILRLPKPSTV